MEADKLTPVLIGGLVACLTATSAALLTMFIPEVPDTACLIGSMSLGVVTWFLTERLLADRFFDTVPRMHLVRSRILHPDHGPMVHEAWIRASTPERAVEEIRCKTLGWHAPDGRLVWFSAYDFGLTPDVEMLQTHALCVASDEGAASRDDALHTSARTFAKRAETTTDPELARALADVASSLNEMAAFAAQDHDAPGQLAPLVDFALPKALAVLEGHARLASVVDPSPREASELETARTALLEMPGLVRGYARNLRGKEVERLAHDTEALRAIALEFERPAPIPS